MKYKKRRSGAFLLYAAFSSSSKQFFYYHFYFVGYAWLYFNEKIGHFYIPLRMHTSVKKTLFFQKFVERFPSERRTSFRNGEFFNCFKKYLIIFVPYPLPVGFNPKRIIFNK
jgi:hypothetical protein